MKVAREKAAVTEPRLLHPLLAIPSRRRGLSHDQQARLDRGRGGLLTLHDRDAVARPRDLWPLPPSPGSHQCVAEVPLSQAGAQELQQPPEPPGQINRLPPHPVKGGKGPNRAWGPARGRRKAPPTPPCPELQGFVPLAPLELPPLSWEPTLTFPTRPQGSQIPAGIFFSIP